LVDDGFDVRDLKVGPPDAPSASRAAAASVPDGSLDHAARTYEAFVSVGRRDGTPQLALPMAGDDGVRRYAVGRLTLRE
jgi:hypothetical protein